MENEEKRTDTTQDANLDAEDLSLEDIDAINDAGDPEGAEGGAEGGEGDQGKVSHGGENHDGDEGDTNADGDSEEDFYLQYNHKVKAVKVEEARKLAQLGMKYQETLAPQVKALQRLAKASGTDLNGLTETIKAGKLKEIEKSLEDKVFDEATRKELAKAKLNELSGGEDQKEQPEEETDDEYTTRMAEEFAELKEAYPAITEFKKIPKETLQTAAKRGISLLDAQLRVEHQKASKSAAVNKAQEAAKKASTGAVKQEPGDKTGDPEIAAMLKAFGG